MPIIAITTITTSIEHTKGRTCSMSGYGLSCHITYFRTATILIYITIVYGNVYVTTDRIGGIDTSTIEFGNLRMIDFKSDIRAGFYLLIASTCHNVKFTTIGVTTWSTLIGRR